jgi:hypothetical protein
MTGIIICDKCSKMFLAHGSRDSLPKEISNIELFRGWRFIESKEKPEPISTISKFLDLCIDCKREIDESAEDMKKLKAKRRNLKRFDD